jgi:hypothetical protein
MAFAPIVTPATAAQATPQPFDASLYSQVILAADVLAGAETCTVWVKVNGTFVPMSNSAGTAASLTATVPAIVLPGGVIYGVTKAATVGTCGVFGTAVLWK